MKKYCDNVYCTYRLCKYHASNKVENDPYQYEIADLYLSKECKSKFKPIKRRNRDLEIFKSKRGSANNVE